jgi:hypothetical protein
MKTNETNRPAAWEREAKEMFTRHWREKLLAGILAFFFWNMIKQQIRPMSGMPPDFVQQHGLQGATGL